MNNDQFWRTRNLKSQVTALREVPISHYSAVSLGEIVTFISTMESGGDHGDAADRLTQFRRGYATGDVETCLWNRGVPPDAG